MQDSETHRCLELTQERGRLIEERERVERRLARVQSELDERDTRLGRWRNRDELAWLRGDHKMAAQRLEAIDSELGRIDDRLATLPPPQQVAALRDEYRDLAIALHDEAQQRVDGFTRHCPAYLLTTIGEAPPEFRGRSRWQEAALRVEHYRIRWNITDPIRPLGDEPTNPHQANEHRLAAARLDEVHRDLLEERTAQRGLSRSRGISLSR
ncbi:MAG: hypothetical protein ACRDUY_07380 [Nitriliruptorales bacterium]